MDVDSAFRAAAEQGRRPRRQGAALPPSMINRILAARSARKFPYAQYGRKVYLRGTARGVAKYGTSYRSATPMQRQQRSMDGIIGSGAYLGRTLGSAAGAYLGGAAGSAFGPGGTALGASAGGWAGRIAGNVLEDAAVDYAIRKGPSLSQIPLALYSGAGAYRRVTGSGAYTQTNSLFQGGMGVPQFSTMPGDETGALHINHTEYIQDVLGTTAFTNQSFPINPGDPGVFPWLSQLAANYDEFEFNGLMFHYKSVSGDLSTASVQLGTVIMATNYNAGAAPFGSKQSMMEYDGAARVKVSEELTSGVECDKSKSASGGTMYVALNGTVPEGQDVKTYYPGVFQLATNQCASTVQIGELWVSYKVTLRKAKLAVNQGLQIMSSGVRANVSSAVLNVALAAVTTGSGNGYFNNLEDLKYDSTVTQPSGSQINGGAWVTSTLNFTPSLTGIGWHYTANTGNCQFTYVFPPWLQQGTFQVSTRGVPATGGHSAPIITQSAGVTVNPSEESNGLTTVNVSLNQSYAGTGVVQFIRITTTGTFTWSTVSSLRAMITMINPAIDINNAEF